MNYQDFKTIGQLGCGQCYKAFKKNLLPLLKRIHGSTQYFGKMPAVSGAQAGAGGRTQAAKVKALSDAQQLQDLRAKLQKAIQGEEFEEAARLRDRIRELEKKNEV